MKVSVLDWLRGLRASYWFLPSLMALAAVVMSVVMVMIDSRIGSGWMRDIGWLYSNQPDGARAVLSTIAGSMITVAGVTFSMTILTVSFAAGQIGPRLMNNFMRDRGNQITLGTFISTFLYCLMVLRTVRNPGEGDAEATYVSEAFVPQLSILFALVLAILSVGVLIYFIHHVPDSINVSQVIAGVGRDLNQMVDHQFPTRVGESGPDDASSTGQNTENPYDFDQAECIRSRNSGYIRAVDDEQLIRIAKDHDLLVRLEYRPGDFVSQDKTLMYACPAERVDDDVRDSLRSVFVLGSQRSRHQNMFFLIDELVEIIARALSPGINDPFTAIACIDWLQSVLSNLATRQPPDYRRYDSEQALRVIAHPIDFVGVADRVFDQLLPYVSSDRNAALSMMKMIAEVASEIEPGPEREAMLGHASKLHHASRDGLALEIDREMIETVYQKVLVVVTNQSERRRFRDSQGWLGGSA